MTKRSGRVVALFAAIAAVALLAIPAAASAKVACETIQGAGSSLQNIAQNEVWAPEWKTAASPECLAATEVKYRSSSSGKGKNQWGANAKKELLFETTKEKTLSGGKAEEQFPAFIGTDLAPTKTQMEEMGEAGKLLTGAKTANKIVSIPVVQSAIAVMISLPVKCEPATGTTTATVTGKHLQEEFESNKPQYLTLVAKVGAQAECNVAPKLQVRSANSGTTAGFKRFLGSIGTADLANPESATWKPLNETGEKSENTEWPAGATVNKCCEKGSELAETVFKNAGELGYADLADARKAGFTTEWKKTGPVGSEFWVIIAKVETQGESISPEVAGNKESNCTKTVYKGIPANVKAGEDWSAVRQENTEKALSAAYPICTLTYDLAWQHYEWPSLTGDPEIKYTQGEFNAVHEYLKWVTSTGQTLALLLEKHYGKLPAALITKDGECFTNAEKCFAL
ncbi:MAG TPA: hypothetical protein VHT29_14375 [Solirubrobacteraceae bacterium]|jgi:hypothetical protein|nr:hypothetical protein [Solirubrobacteraceae bacterium]